ncbi:MAG: glutaredoxin [Clostridiales bacterium]|nr:glutaredoxin [Clostridiales bacterium]
MKITVIGSHLCPDTLEALGKLAVIKADTDFKDILANHDNLRSYLKLRDTNPMYDDIRGTDRMGIPCFIFENGDMSFDTDEVIKKLS